MSAMGPSRDMTVGELIEALREFPDYYPVAPIVDGTIGVATAVRCWTHERQPLVLVGEADLPPHLIESLIHGKGKP